MDDEGDDESDKLTDLSDMSDEHDDDAVLNGTDNGCPSMSTNWMRVYKPEPPNLGFAPTFTEVRANYLYTLNSYSLFVTLLIFYNVCYNEFKKVKIWCIS